MARFDLPEEVLGKRIDVAYIDVDLAAGGGDPSEVKLEARRLSRSWEGGEVGWEDLFGETGGMGPEESACLIEPGGVATARFEVTDLVQSSLDVPASNLGLVVSENREGTTLETRSRRISGARVGPLLRIWYSE